MRIPRVGLVPIAAVVLTLITTPGSAPAGEDERRHQGPRSPIEHVIVVVGENHTFDNVFGVYRPRHGKVWNL